MAHTPGPWVVQGQAVLSDRPYPEWKQIAGVRIGNADNWSDPEGESNARLIAASPDLLAALKRLVEYCNNHSDYDAIGEADAAISKAEGRSE